jgi:hypothetical protein
MRVPDNDFAFCQGRSIYEKELQQTQGFAISAPHISRMRFQLS